MNNKLKRILQLVTVAGLFVAFSYLIQKNLYYLEGIVDNSPIGILTYILIEISSIVLAPVTTFPLIIIATNIYGWFYSGLYSLLAWIIGSYLAFKIARKYGLTVIKRFVSIEKIHAMEQKFLSDNLLWNMIILRILFPTDILSYAAGIFSKIKTKDYLLATTIGLAPFAFGLSIFGRITYTTQLLIILLAGIITLSVWGIITLWKKMEGKRIIHQ